MEEHFFIYNGLLFESGTPLLDEKNRAFKYGDGLFETMRIYQGNLINGGFHFERFFKGLSLLKIPVTPPFSEAILRQNIQTLLEENSIETHARVRLMAFRGGNSLLGEAGEAPGYILEVTGTEAPILLNDRGLKVEVFADSKKSGDLFSNVTTNNYLSSIMAMLYAQENQMDECFLLNASGRICESAISNVFIIHRNKLITPPLSEGGIAGVVRRWLIENLHHMGREVEEKTLSIEDVWAADEIFLTNSLKWVRWVKEFRGKFYSNEKTSQIAQFAFRKMTDST